MLRASLLAAVAVIPMAGMANATPITFTGSYSVAANSGPNGLPVNTQAEYGTPPGQFSLSLNQGQPYGPIDLFEIWTNATSVTSADRTPEPISVRFDFTAPGPAFGGSATGTTMGGAFLGIFQYGQLTWNNNGILDIAYPGGGNGDLQIALSGGQFNNSVFGLQGGQGDGLYVLATFTDVSNPTAVPEPMPLALLGTGVLGLGLCRPRRKPARHSRRRGSPCSV